MSASIPQAFAEPASAIGASLPPDIQMVAIDLDGTLLNDSKKVSGQTIAALSCLADRGVKVVIASARPPRSVRAVYAALGLGTWQVNYNGAMIWDEPSRTVIFHRPMEPGLVRRIIVLAREHDPEVLVSCEISDKWYTDRYDNTFTTETGRMFKPDVVSPVDSFCTVPITKLLLLGPPEVMTSLQPILKHSFDQQVSLVRTDPELLQLMEKRVSKGLAVRMVARHYGISMRNVMAIGDAPNDVGMLQLAGVAIAMDNAQPIVKQVADWIAPSNNDHGVHAALKRYKLCD